MRTTKIGALMITLCLLLTACGSKDRDNDELALDIRTAYIGMAGCTAQMDVTADYGRRVYDYSLDLNYQKGGEMVLTVTAPAELVGVTARLADGSAILQYDGMSVETGPLDAEGLSPISAVPALLDAVKTGYMARYSREAIGETECLRVSYRDPEREADEGSELTAWFHPETKALTQGEISVDGKRVVLCRFSKFTMS